jgi:hypothetical protein
VQAELVRALLQGPGIVVFKPMGGLVPQSQAQLLTQAVEEDWHVGRLRMELAAQQDRSRA